MSDGKAFFDTNVLLYMYSTAEPEKQLKARELYREFAYSNRIQLSTQVVQEFFVVAMRKLRLPRQQVVELADSFLNLSVVTIDATHIRYAIDLEGRYQISFWDALILAAAESADVEVLYSEDLNDGQRYGGVLVRNPFLN
jgi:predicted nucleic acid-binding protein